MWQHVTDRREWKRPLRFCLSIWDRGRWQVSNLRPCWSHFRFQVLTQKRRV